MGFHPAKDFTHHLFSPATSVEFLGFAPLAYPVLQLPRTRPRSALLMVYQTACSSPVRRLLTPWDASSVRSLSLVPVYPQSPSEGTHLRLECMSAALGGTEAPLELECISYSFPSTMKGMQPCDLQQGNWKQTAASVTSRKTF